MYGQRNLQAKVEEYRTDEWLDALFRKRYRTELAEGNAFVESLWFRVRPALQVAFDTVSACAEDVPAMGPLLNLLTFFSRCCAPRLALIRYTKPAPGSWEKFDVCLRKTSLPFVDKPLIEMYRHVTRR